MEKRGCLYVGGDDSNHAGDSKGEIIVATFSFNPEDAIITPFGFGHRKQLKLRHKYEEWVSERDRDFRFAVLMADQYRHSGQNLPNIMPDLIKDYFGTRRKEIPSLRVFLDGLLEEKARTELTERILEFWRGNPFNLEVSNFAKRKKRHNCPPLVYHADNLAYSLCHGPTFKELSMHEKLVLIK